MSAAFVFLLCLSAALGESTTPRNDLSVLRAAGIENTYEANLALTSQIYAGLARRHRPGANFVFSTLGVQVALGLLHAGAGGTTAAQLAAKMHGPDDAAAVRRAFRAIFDVIYDGPTPGMYTYTALLLDRRASLDARFASVARDSFNATVERVDFAAAPFDGVDAWFHDRTGKKFAEIDKEAFVDANTRMVVVNGEHYASGWVLGFDPRSTEEETFHADGEKKKSAVPMMHLTGYFKGYRSKMFDAHILEIPIAQENCVMHVILPRKKRALSTVEEKLTSEKLAKIQDLFDKKQKRKIHVAMPRFTLVDATDMTEVLKAMGFVDVFNASVANLTAISPANVALDRLVHKVVFRVDEKGDRTEYVYVPSKPSTKKARQFVLDRPFVFVIQCTQLRVALYAGRYVGPDVK